MKSFAQITQLAGGINRECISGNSHTFLSTGLLNASHDSLILSFAPHIFKRYKIQ